MNTINDCGRSPAGRVYSPPPPPRKLSKRIIWGRVARAAVLFVAGLAGVPTAQAQTASIDLRFAGLNADGRPQFSFTIAGFSNFSADLYRHDTGCDFAEALSNTENGGARRVNTNTITSTPAVDESDDANFVAGQTYYYAILGNDVITPANNNTVSNCVSNVMPGGAADESILPSVIRGLQQGIYNRIQQRQRQDGRWK